MPTLLEALEQKYGGLPEQDVEESNESPIIIFVPKLPRRSIIPDLLILNDCDIDRAGEPDDLHKKCVSVKELDLAQNKLQNWTEVLTILSHMPHVEFVNLSFNPLIGPINPPRDFSMSKLSNLVLNNTHLDWECVETLIKLLPALEELHLSLNDYQNVLIDTIDDNELIFEVTDDDNNNDELEEMRTGTPPYDCDIVSRKMTAVQRSCSTSSQYKRTDAHNGLKKLHFTGNPVSEWNEICRLGRVFPNLELLVLAECPLKAVRPIADNKNCDKSDNEFPPHTYFPNLSFLNLSSTNINSWEDIDRLAKFPALKNLRVQNWPLWDKCESTEHERRQLLIARLPHVETLNGGGAIGVEEREDAQRAFIRYYMDKPESERPARYEELLNIHGKLDPLVNINLKPDKRVKVQFTCGDIKEVRSVDVYRTVVDLKNRLERLANIPASKMRLYYVDRDLCDLQGPEEMKYPNKQLYSYNIRNGDEIIIDKKI